MALDEGAGGENAVRNAEELALRFPHGKSASLIVSHFGGGSDSVPARLMPCGQRCETSEMGLYVLTLLHAALPPEAEISCGDTVSLGSAITPQWRVKELERFPDYAMCLMEEIPQ